MNPTQRLFAVMFFGVLTYFVHEAPFTAVTHQGDSFSRALLNSESQLAMGILVEPNQETEALLVLIGGISPTLVGRITKWFKHQYSPNKEGTTGIESVKGIGRKKAVLLGRYLSLGSERALPVASPLPRHKTQLLNGTKP